MTTLADHTPITPAAPGHQAATLSEQSGTRPTRRPLSTLGGVALAVGPLLVIGGNLTSPPQASGSPADYIASLARDLTLTSASATLYHYGWILIAFGILAGMGLVRGHRGRGLALVGGVGAAFGAIQLSGLLLTDWFLASAGRNLTSAQAVTLFTQMGDLSVDIWRYSAQLGAIVWPVVFYAGLARAGVVSWLVVPLILLPMVAPFVLAGLVAGVPGMVLGAVVGLVGFLPAFVTAARLIVRGRLLHDS